MSIDPIERWNLTLSGIAAAVSYFLASPLFAASLAAGALLEVMNFRGLRRSGELLFSGQLRVGWSAGFAARFSLLALGVAGAIYAGAHPVGLLVGLSLMVPAALLEAWRTRPPVLSDAPALPPDDPSWDRWNAWLAREGEEPEEER